MLRRFDVSVDIYRKSDLFSVRSKDLCMIACNTHLVTQLVSLESFECTHKEIFFLRDHWRPRKETVRKMFKETCKKTVSVSTLCFILDVHNICMQLFFRCSMLTVIQKPKVPMLLFGTPFSNFKTQTLQRNCFFAYYVE